MFFPSVIIASNAEGKKKKKFVDSSTWLLRRSTNAKQNIYKANKQTYKIPSLSVDSIRNRSDSTIGYDFQSILNFV